MNINWHIRSKIFWLLAASLTLLAGPLSAEIQTKVINYQDGDTTLKGHLYWDDIYSGKRPGVMVVHEWWGLNDYAKLRAEMLAELGYVAFAADMYGDGKLTRHADDAKGWMQQITMNEDKWQKRALLGLEQLKSHPDVEADKLAAIGYCFGGSTVMKMAYSGAEQLKGVVSFHGSLPPATEEQAAAIKAQILVAHGGSDSFVPEERFTAFQNGLQASNEKWEIDIYGAAKHGFTNPYADGYGMKGLEYDEVADQRSWLRMQDFLKEVFEVEEY